MSVEFLAAANKELEAHLSDIPILTLTSAMLPQCTSSSRFDLPLEMALDHACAVVVHVRQRLIGHVYEWNIVEVPLWISVTFQIGFMVQDISCLQERVCWRVWTIDTGDQRC